jgi:hypothetical protein
MTDNGAEALSDCLSTASNDWMAVNNKLEKFEERRYSIIWLRGFRKNHAKPSEQSVSRPSFEPGTYRTKVRNLRQVAQFRVFQLIFKNRGNGLHSWVYCQKRLRYFLGERSALEPISSNFPFANTPRLDLPSSFLFCPVTILSDFIYSQSHQHFFQCGTATCWDSCRQHRFAF